MPKTVTVACHCEDAVVSVVVQHTAQPERLDAATPRATFRFQQKTTRALMLDPGRYRVAYRAAGAAHAPVSLTVAKGGTMRPVSTMLGPDGRAAGVRTLIVALWLVGVMASPSVAQNADPPATREAAKAEARQVMDALPAAGRVATGTLAMSVEANATERRGAIALVLSSRRHDRFTATITVGGPLSSDTGSAQPLSASGLSNTATIEFALNWFLWRGHADPVAAAALCRARLGREDCDDADFAEPRDRRRFLSLLGADVSPIFVSIAAEEGRDRFRYLQTSSFVSASEAHAAHAASVTVGRIGPRTGFLGVGYEYRSGWLQNHAAREICVTIDESAALECRTAPVGGPAASRRHLVSVESRRFIAGRHVAISPKVTWNARSHRTSVTVPVYFIGSGEARLSGGIKVGWNSATRDTTVTLFIGPVFRVRPS